jgi:hypothetical protein
MANTSGTAPFFLGIDVGGTNVKAGVVDNTGLSLSKVSLPTEASKGPLVGVGGAVPVRHPSAQAGALCPMCRSDSTPADELARLLAGARPGC